ncbi:MAG: U32 family peptidase [Firmicutes bacterium]|nr:U32 family peptidase [Bacillota bacterium]
MKTACPLSRIKETAVLAKAGADEFYCGMAPGEWKENYGMIESITRRNNPFAHLHSLEDIRKVIATAHKYGKPVHITLNETYHKEQTDYLVNQVGILHEAGADAIILGDMGSLLAIKEAGIPVKLFMGTGGTALNSQTVKLYKKMGADRVILDRHLTVEEIRAIIESEPEIEYEAFIFRGLCPFIDGFCHFDHGINETLGKKPRVDLACAMKYKIKNTSDSKCPHKSEIGSLISGRQSLTGCGLCALFDFRKIKGLTALKIVGREFSSKEKLEDLKLVRGALDLLKEKPEIGKEEFLSYCREQFRVFFEKACGYKDCYYPEFLPGRTRQALL